MQEVFTDRASTNGIQSIMICAMMPSYPDHEEGIQRDLRFLQSLASIQIEVILSLPNEPTTPES